MPVSAPKPCCVCSVLVRDGSSRCDKHKVRQGTFADQSWKGSRHERGYGNDWDRRRKRILARDNGLCQCDECRQLNRIRIATQVDHVVNKAEWRRRHGGLVGVDDDSNLQSINAECHKRKTAREALAGRSR